MICTNIYDKQNGAQSPVRHTTEKIYSKHETVTPDTKHDTGLVTGHRTWATPRVGDRHVGPDTHYAHPHGLGHAA